MKTFIHKFSNGEVIRLTFDLSKDRPECKSSMKIGTMPVAVLSEYLTWRNAVVLPELMNCLNSEQVVNMALPSLK